MKTANDPKQIKLRKYENILAVSGVAVIAFGVWTIIKAAFYLFLNPFNLEIFISPEEIAEAKAEAGEIAGTVMSGVVIAIIFIVLLMDLLLRMYIGRSAYSDGRARKKKSIVYVIIAIFIIFAFANSIGFTISNMINGTTVEQTEAEEYMSSAFTSLFLDMTSLLALVELAFSAIQVRRLRKDLGIEVKDRKDTLAMLEEETSEIIENTGLEV